MPVAESKYHQAVDALKTALAAITASAVYHYTTTAAAVAPGLDETALDGAPSQGTGMFVVLMPDDEVAVEQTSGTIVKEAYVDIAVFTPFKPANEAVWRQESTPRTTVQDRMVQDIERAIYADVTLGALVDNTEVVVRDRSADRTWIDKFALVFLRVKLSWEEPWVQS